MKSMTRILIVSAAATIIAASAFAQLSAENRDWAKGPVQFIMTAQEQQQWNQIGLLAVEVAEKVEVGAVERAEVSVALD